VGEGISNAAQWVGRAAKNVVGFAQKVGQVFGLGSQPDRPFDGMMVGAGNRVYPPGTPLSDIDAVEPWGRQATGTVIYVNGIVTDLEGQGDEMQNIADSTGMRVIGIHNSTEGAGADLAQCVGDKLDKGTNPAVDTLADTIYSELKAGRDVHLMGYSQGGLITARALKDVAQRLRIEDGMSKEAAEQLMSHINVETFGSAGAVYPDGPRYVHYVNDKDIVPGLFGLGIDIPDLFNVITNPGRDAVVHHFKHGGTFEFSEAHDLENAYLSRRVDFEQARAGQF
jgi:hypothetical protein